MVFEGEVAMPIKLSGLGEAIKGLLADREEAEAGRQHEAFLRA
jgi:hypothetical protein